MHWGRKQIWVVLVVSLCVGVTTAQLTKPAALQEQKQDVMESVYSNPDFLPLIDVDQARIQLTDLSESFQALTDEYELLDTKRAQIEKKYGNVQLTIDKILRDTQNAKDKITGALTRISLLTKKIEELKTDLANLEKEIASSQEHLTHYTTFLYKFNNDYYGKDLEVSDLKLLTKSDNIAATLSTDMLVQMLTTKLQALVYELQKQQTRYQEFSVQLNEAKIAYQETAATFKKDLESLEQQKKHLYLLLSYLQQDKAAMDGEIHAIGKSKEELHRQLSVMRTVSNSSLEKGADKSSQIYTLLQLADRDDGQRYFTRPVLPVSYIQYYFQDPVYEEAFGEEYQGITIDLPQGSPVRSPAPGIVYAVHEGEDIELNWIVIVHKYGYTTFFSPLSEVFVKPGQLVKRGEIIGNSGGQPGTAGAGLESSSPHLSLEVLKNGEPVDPLSLLDLSIFLEEDMLPEEYGVKYLQDALARGVDLSKLPQVTGKTVAERRDDFLRRYAGGPWGSAALRYDGALDTGIDPLFGICIGFAETSFRNFKTSNNIGNVGNNDRGDTVTYDSPLAGVKALFNVLNNQYLGDYYTIDELSRFGNKEGYIYASSPYNRQKNVMNCLSTIHGYPIPEDYPFRMRLAERNSFTNP